MEKGQSLLNATLKEVCIRYFYAMIIISSLFAIYYIYMDIKPLNYIVASCPIIHLLLFVIPYRLNYESIKPLISIYLIYLSFFLFINVLFFWLLGQITAFMWFAIIPVATMLFFNKKTNFYFGIYILILTCSIFIIRPFISIEEYNWRPNDNNLTVINMMTIISSIGLIIYFVYYLNKINIIKELHFFVYEEDLDEDNDPQEICVNENLYNEILTYFSENKPYCSPDFTITQLAKELDSNVKYISKAIKDQENVNFRTFINRYRVTLVKELITKDIYNKYTISYIYTIAGFRNQSTFNKVFKEIEGITPSEYMNKYR